MHRMPIPCPHLETQRQLIASMSERLTATDDLINSCRSQLAEIEAIPRALLRAAFDGDS
jgi:hypothetical protein